MGLKIQTALIQMTSGPDMAKSVAYCCAQIEKAAKAGAQFILTPEMTNIIEPKRSRLHEVCYPEEQDPYLAQFKALAKKQKIWLLIGSMAFLEDQGHLSNRSIFIDPDGVVAGRYNKIHMFDVKLPNGEEYKESNTFKAGSEAVLVETSFAKIGLSICYDLRFPILYQNLAMAGAEIIVVPSAFTRPTGKAHWHTLLKARAIETGCFILAPAQTGFHGGSRKTYGHSLIVNPWGDIVCDGKVRKGVLTACLDLKEVSEARAKIPSLKVARTKYKISS